MPGCSPLLVMPALDAGIFFVSEKMAGTKPGHDEL